MNQNNIYAYPLQQIPLEQRLPRVQKNRAGDINYAKEVVSEFLDLKAADLLSYGGKKDRCRDGFSAYDVITGDSKDPCDITVRDVLLAMTKVGKPRTFFHAKARKGRRPAADADREAKENIPDLLTEPLYDLPAIPIGNKSLMDWLAHKVHFIKAGTKVIFPMADVRRVNERLTRYDTAAHPELLTVLRFFDLNMEDFLLAVRQMAELSDRHWFDNRESLKTLTDELFSEPQELSENSTVGQLCREPLSGNIYTTLLLFHPDIYNPATSRSAMRIDDTERYYRLLFEVILDPLEALAVRLSGRKPADSYLYTMPEKYEGADDNELSDYFQMEDYWQMLVGNNQAAGGGGS